MVTVNNTHEPKYYGGVLSTRLAFRSALLLLVTMVCTLFLEMHWTSQDRAQESRDDLVRRLNSIEPNIVQALWRVDSDTIRVAVNSIGNGPGVVSVSVRAQFRVNDINETFAVPGAQNHTCSHEFIRDYSDYVVEGMEIGSGLLKVCYSEALLPTGYMIQDPSGNLIRTFCTTAIMAAMLFWLIGRSVIRPLNQLISMVRTNTLTAESRLDRSAMDRGDEIDDLCAEMAERARVLELTHRDDKLRVLGMLASGVAHDFNNLLAVISGSANLIKCKSDDLTLTREMSETIVQASMTGFALTRRMSVLSSQQKRLVNLVNISETFEHLGIFTDILLKEGVPIHFDPDGDMNVYVDAGGLEAALLNLIMNARDSISKNSRGEIRVQSRYNAGTRPETVDIIVRDNGSGIPKKFLDKVTEPFFTTKAEGKGSGLGLSMVSEFVAINGGEFQIDSTEGVGTTATITFPIATDTAKNEHLKNDQKKASLALIDDKAKVARNAKTKIFVLDDEPGLARTLALTLQTLDYSCDFSDNAVELLNDAQKLGEYDILLCDVLLGPITGPELYEQFKSILKEKCPKVIFISGALPETADDSLLYTNVDDVLLKPFSAERLEMKIQDILTKEAA